MSKRKGQRRPTERARDVHIMLIQSMEDPGLAAASCRQDAAADRAWFHAHPGQTKRVRPASILEMGAFGLSAGSTVEIIRMSDGSQVRCFFPPPE